MRGDLIEIFKVIGGVSKGEHAIILDDIQHHTRGHGLKIAKQHCRAEVRRNFFTERVVNF